MFLKSKKGVAGTEVVIQLMIAVFVIGLLAMLIVITSSQMLESTGFDTSNSILVVGESLGAVSNSTATSVAVAGYKDAKCSWIAVMNDTQAVIVNSGNYTINNCAITRAKETYKTNTWYANYTYTYSAISTSGDVINSTMASVRDVPDNFSLWLVVGGLVVVIGLIAFVIMSLRGTGMLGA
jgi:hypothetical protein